MPPKRTGHAVDPRTSELVSEAFRILNSGDEPGALEKFERVLQVEPTNSNALVQTGLRGIGHPAFKARAFARISLAFEAGTPQKLTAATPQGLLLATLTGRYHVERNEYYSARKFYEMCLASPARRGFCQMMQMATLVPVYPRSCDEARLWINQFHKGLDFLLKQVFCCCC